MSRNLPRAVAAVALLALAAAACDAGRGETTAPPGTVAVEGVLDAFPPTVPDDPPASDPPEATEPPATSSPPSTSPPPSSEPSTTTTTEPAVTSLRQLLAGLVDGAVVPDPPVDRVVDDTGRLSMDVPTAWTERSTSAGRTAAGRTAPYLAASPDMEAFLDGYEVPGITVVGLTGGDDVDAVLGSYRFGQDCRASSTRPYEGRRMAGEWRAFRGCGDTDTDIVTVVLEPPGSGTVLVLAQIVDAEDLAALDVALGTLSLRAR